MAAIVGATGVLYARPGALVGDCGCISSSERTAFAAWNCVYGSGVGPGEAGFCPPQSSIDTFNAWYCSYDAPSPGEEGFCPPQAAIDSFDAWSCSYD